MKTVSYLSLQRKVHRISACSRQFDDIYALINWSVAGREDYFKQRFLAKSWGYNKHLHSGVGDKMANIFL